MITRKVDLHDASPAGATCRLVEKMAKQIEQLKVICLERGEVGDLLKVGNVKIESLGKEKGFSRLREIWEFHKLARFFIKQVDGVFCHQNPEYTILIAPYAKLFRKKIVSWYTHKAVNWKLHLLNLLTDRIITASAKSCRLKNRKKIEVTGHGIDVNHFKKDERRVNDKFNIVSIGRIAPTKDCNTLVEAVEILVRNGMKNIRVKIIGTPVLARDREYYRNLLSAIKEKELSEYVQCFGSGIAHNQILEEYLCSDLMVNLSHTGSVDKAVLEAMACERLVLTCNEAFVNILNDQRLLFEKKNPQDLAQKITKLMILSEDEKGEIGQRLRKEVVENHNLNNLIQKILGFYEK